METVKQQTKGKAGKPRWLLRPVSDDFAARLFCFPYSGCGASMFRQWPTHLGAVEICPLQLPGRENRTREPHYGTYENLADMLVDVLPPYLDRPYAFIGHCGGVLPAFETMLRLIERGHPAPAHFFVSSQVAPHDGPYGRFLQLSRDELSVEIRKLIQAMNGPEPSPDMMDLFLDVLVSDVNANKQYNKFAPIELPCSLTVFGWTNDVEVQPELMGGWKEYGPTQYIILEGEHYSFLSGPETMLNEVQRQMEAIVGCSATPAELINREINA